MSDVGYLWVQACVELYHAGTILDIYQKARGDISTRPWRVDHFDAFADCYFAKQPKAAASQTGAHLHKGKGSVLRGGPGLQVQGTMPGIAMSSVCCWLAV